MRVIHGDALPTVPNSPVAVLEELLRAARAGEFKHVTVVTISAAQPDTVRLMWSYGATRLEQTGALHWAVESISPRPAL